MKILNCCLLCLSLCISTTTSADTLPVNLSQQNKKVSVQLNKDDVLSVKYAIDRRPVLRSSEWWYYAIWCTSSDASTLEYTFRDVIKNTTLPALLSNDIDKQKVGLNIDVSGIFKIKNQSLGKIYITCELYNKFGH